MPQAWTAPDGSRSVVFAPGVVKALRARVLDGFYSLPKRGAEIGGLLMGAVLDTEPPQTSITGFEEIPCQHRYGPSYILMDDDIPQLQAELARERPDPVIGFFRSYTGRDMALDDADRNLLERYLPNPSLVLLLQPSRPADCLAGFLFPESGDVGFEPQHPPFDFNEEQPAVHVPEEVITPIEAPSMVEASSTAGQPVITDSVVGDQPIAPTGADEASPLITPVEPAPPEPAPVEAVSRAAPAIPHLPPPKRRHEHIDQEPPPSRRHLLLPVSLAILLCVAAGAVYGLWSRARAPRWAPLGLNAELADHAIHLAWNKSLPSVQDAGRGVLIIDDGSGNKRVELTPQQIRGGAYDYQAGARDVLFRLELFGSGTQAAGDSLRVVVPPAATAAVPPPSLSLPPAPSRESSADREIPRPHAAEVAVAPKPLREIQPEIPSGIRVRIHGRVVVPVEVEVAATGRVTSAASRGSGNDIYEYLSTQATQAARQWRFSPARARNGEAIAASRMVYFVFTSR